ncbi:MotA/TolQ/ExbB proton channel family protein [Chitinispirillales bacterium ANBcel5]|uniref:MotA/TolQ/ExbB proton channel family protein n=1 Tax=Cellulosispirillum alkaliphilum TaxID=3039283 RepID=UPI002A51F57F|nr:MotA/TolQ/ExbB proton channel family protein [Chitinispirillales bacterium ANBcel5]
MQLFKFIVDGFVSPGSFAMWAILMIMAASIGLVIERVWYLFLKCGGSGGTFMAGISKFLKSGDYEKAIKYSNSQKTPLAKGVTVILQNRGKGTKAVQKAVDEVFLTETPKISRNIPLLPTLANLATLLGLMGTIYGLMLSFDAVANVPAAQRAQALATGISVAMSTTLFGLIGAIPTLLVHGLLSTKSDRVIEELDEKTSKLINLVEE